MEQITYTTNDTFAAAWWTPMVTYNDSVYVAFTTPCEKPNRHFLNVAKRDADGKWLNHIMTRYDFLDDYGHNQTAMAVDGSGRIHVLTSMHNHAWTYQGDHYYRSTNPEDITDWLLVAHELPNQQENYGYTYPIMRRHPSGDIYLIVRRHQKDVRRSPMLMYRWTNSTSSWSIVDKITRDDTPENMFIYPDDMVITDDGIVHFVFAHHSDNANARRHLPAYMNYNPTTGAFKTGDGTTVTLPVSHTLANLVYKPLVSGETITTTDPGPGHQSAALSMELGYPSIMYRHRETEGGVNKIRRARFSSTVWQDEVIFEGAETSAAIAHKITADSMDVYYCAADGNGDYKLWRSSKSIATGNITHTKLSDITLSRLYLDGNILYASHNPDLSQYLFDVS